MNKKKLKLIHDINSNINSLLQVCEIVKVGESNKNYSQVISLFPEKVDELYKNWKEFQKIDDTSS